MLVECHRFVFSVVSNPFDPAFCCKKPFLILFSHCPTFRSKQGNRLYHCIIVSYIFILVFYVNSFLFHILVIIPNACEVCPILFCMSFLLLPSSFIRPFRLWVHQHGMISPLSCVPC